MRPGVHVKSIEALEAFRAALYIFGEEAEQSLSSIQLEADKFLSWLEEDQIKFWRDEVRLREEIVNEAKTELHRCLQATVDAYRTPSCHHEKKVLDAAKKKLHLAEDKLTLVRRWIPKVKQAVNEYRMKAEPLRNSAVSDVPRAAAFLQASVNRLLEYISISAPNTEGIMERVTQSRAAGEAPEATESQPAGEAQEAAEPNIAGEAQESDLQLTATENSQTPPPTVDDPTIPLSATTGDIASGQLTDNNTVDEK
ncbi:MAG TPA: hypothetical protein VGN12_12680 [Pirellulales bacterium]|jgi:hypothetical protein